MPTPIPRLISKPQFESPAAWQLRKGFPWLRFNSSLEQEFRQSLQEQTRWSICAHLLLGTALVSCFILLDQLVLKRTAPEGLLWVRIGALAPLVICAIVVAKAALYRKIYPV